MDDLLIGTLLPGAVPIQRQNVNPVWRGNVTLGQIRRQMYVKAVEPRTLAVEVICALVGRSIGLPIPRPALVRVTERALPGVIGSMVFFGSESVDNPDLKQWLSRDPDQAMDQLSQWSKLIDAGCFDEWSGNADRHGGNILYGGGSNFALIDHSEAIPRNLQVGDPAPANLLLTYAAGDQSPKTLDALIKKAKTSCQPFAGASVRDEILAILKGLSDAPTVDSLMAFLHQRIHALMLLISTRIGHAQSSLELQKK